MDASYADLAVYSDHRFDYDRFVNDMREAVNLPEEYHFLEIGTRDGGSALMALKTIHESKHPKRWLFTVDPYGSIPYMADATNDQYDDARYRVAQAVLSNAAYHFKLNHYMYRMLSTDFMDNWTKAPFYYENRQINSDSARFAFIYLDGSHDPNTVRLEFEWAQRHLAPGGLVCIDDERFYHVEAMEPVLKLCTNDGQMLHWRNE